VVAVSDRNEQYPVLPPVTWASSKPARVARRVAVDRRNALIGEVGAGRAVAVVGGGSIGGAKKKKGEAEDK